MATAAPQTPAAGRPYQPRAFTVTCAHCGEPFTAESDRARYCPAPKGCKQAAYRARKARQAASVTAPAEGVYRP